MGYETRLLIGQVHTSIGDNYFLKIAEVDLCKCGHEGPMSDLIDKVISKDNILGLEETYYSTSIQIRTDKVKEHLIGGARNVEGLTEEMLDKIVNEAEGWEQDIRCDSYGTVLRAVPIDMVIEAISKEMKLSKEKGESPYRRYIMALPLLKTIRSTFKSTKRKLTIFCILFGY